MKLPTWAYEKEFFQVVRMFNSLTPAERNSFKGWKLQVFGMLFAPPSILKLVAPGRESWLEYLIEDLHSSSFEIRRSGTHLDFLMK